MASTFPSLCPKRRSYSPGVYATKRFTSVSGAGTTRLYGSQPFDGKLSLEFLVDDSELAAVFDCWHDAKGDAFSVRFPKKVFVGMSKAVFMDSLEWRWANPPQVTSVIKGRSTVKTDFVAVLEA